MSRLHTNRYKALFKENDTSNFNHMDIIHRFTSPLLALLFSELFWPKFVLMKNMVFLEYTFEDDDDLNRLDKAIDKWKGDRRKIEESFNMIEIPSLFGSRSEESTDEEDKILAQTIASMWKFRLLEQFPSRKFYVDVLHPEQTGGEIAVIFYQESSSMPIEMGH